MVIFGKRANWANLVLEKKIGGFSLRQKIV